MSLMHRIKPASPKAPEPTKRTTSKLEAVAAQAVKASPVSGNKRGPKPSGNAKKLLTLRLDAEMIDRYRATGKGWQARMAEVLLQHAP